MALDFQGLFAAKLYLDRPVRVLLHAGGQFDIWGTLNNLLPGPALLKPGLAGPWQQVCTCPVRWDGYLI